MKRKVFYLTMALLFAVAIVPATEVFADDAINVTVNGQAVTFTDQAPVIVDGRTLVPVRGVFEALGFTAEWNGDTRTATAGVIIGITPAKPVNTRVLPIQSHCDYLSSRHLMANM